jgi:hypothetical protein
MSEFGISENIHTEPTAAQIAAAVHTFAKFGGIKQPDIVQGEVLSITDTVDQSAEVITPTPFDPRSNSRTYGNFDVQA